MTRGVKKIRPAETPAPTPVAAPKSFQSHQELEAAEEAAGDELETDLSRLVLTSPPGARFRLFRRSDETARWEMHGIFSRDTMSEQNVAELYGGGKYWAQLLTNTDGGGDRVVRSARFRIPGAYIPPAGRLPNVSQGPSGAAAPTAAAPVTSHGIDAQRNLDMAAATKVIELMNGGGARRGPDWAPVIAAALPIVAAGIGGAATLLMKALERKPATDPAIVALLERMEQQLRNNANPPSPVTVGINETVKSLRQLEEVRQLLGGGGDGESKMWDKLPSLLGELLASTRGAPAGDPPQPAADPDDANRAPWERLLRHYAGQLTDAARRGIDPSLAAGMIASYVPSDWQGVLVEFVQRDDAVPAIAQAVPEMQHFQKWTTELVAALKGELLGDDEADE